MRNAGSIVRRTQIIGKIGSIADQKRLDDPAVFGKQAVDARRDPSAQHCRHIRKSNRAIKKFRVFRPDGCIAVQPLHAQVIGEIEFEWIGSAVRRIDVARAFDALGDMHLLQIVKFAANVEPKRAVHRYSVDRKMVHGAYAAGFLNIVIEQIYDIAGDGGVFLLRQRIGGAPCQCKAQRAQRQHGDRDDQRDPPAISARKKQSSRDQADTAAG